MAKKRSVIAGEYVIEIADNGHVDVARIPRNVKAVLREIAESKNFPYDKTWTQRQLANNLLKEFGNGKTLICDGYTVTKREDGGIDVIQTSIKGTVKQTLRDIAQRVGFEYSDEWNQQQLGRNLVIYLEENKEKADKILQTPNGKLKAVEEDMSEKESAACAQTAPNTESDINPSLLRHILKDGKYGYAMDGKEIIPCIYDGIQYCGSGLFFARKRGEGEGVINANNEVIVPLEYDSVDQPSGQGRMEVWKDCSGGLVDLTGKIVIPVLYRKLYPYDDNEKYYIVGKDDFYGIIDYNGTIVVPIDYTLSSNERRIGDDYFSINIFERDGKYYRFDSAKGSMKELPYDRLMWFDETGLAAVRKNGKWGYVNKELEEVVPCENIMCIVDINANCIQDEKNECFFDEKRDVSEFADEYSEDLEDEGMDLSNVEEFNNELISKIFQSFSREFTEMYEFDRESHLNKVCGVYWAEIPGDDNNFYHEWRREDINLEECRGDEIEVHNGNKFSTEKGIHYMYSYDPIAYFFRLLLPNITDFDPSKLVVEDNIEHFGDCELKVSYDGKRLPFLWGSYEDCYDQHNRRLFINGEEYPIADADRDNDEEW